MGIMAAIILIISAGSLFLVGLYLLVPLVIAMFLVGIANLAPNDTCGKPPIWWKIYTFYCGFSATCLLGSEVLFEKEIHGDLNLLLTRYVIVSIIALIWWFCREQIKLNSFAR